MKLLYVKASPRVGRSHSLAVADAFADAYCQAHPADQVEIVESRPLSKTKHWRVRKVLEAARG